MSSKLKIERLRERDTVKAILGSVEWCVDRARHTHYLYIGHSLEDLFNVAKNVTYKVDNEGEQLIRSPKTLVKNGLGDCKSKTLFIVAHAILNSHKDIDIVFTNEDGEGYPAHVFCVIDGVVLDSVHGVYNSYPNFVKKWVYKINSDKMINYRIEGFKGVAGTPVDEARERFVEFYNWVKQYKADPTRLSNSRLKESVDRFLEFSNITNQSQVIPFFEKYGYRSGWVYYFILALAQAQRQYDDSQKNTFLGSVKNAVVKLATKYNPVLIAGRNAYLGLMAVNYRGNATKLKAIDKYGDQKRLREKWESLGGNYDKLIGSVNRGYDKKALFGSSSVSGIGEVSTATGASVATASPILVAMKSLLATLLPALTVAGKTWLDAKTKQLTETATGQSSPTTNTTTNPTTNPTTPTTTTNNNSTSGIDTNTVLMVLAGAGALWFLTKD